MQPRPQGATSASAAIGSAFCWSWAPPRHLGDRKVAYVANFVSGVTIDCVDPQRVARFWSALLGREPGPSQAGWVYLGHRGDPQPRLVFQPVPEPKAGKVRIHLDVTVDDVDEAIELVTILGGRITGERHDYDEGVVVVVHHENDRSFRITISTSIFCAPTATRTRDLLLRRQSLYPLSYRGLPRF
jgi:predicted enzyme related to lactoylglutathione lyase